MQNQYNRKKQKQCKGFKCTLLDRWQSAMSLKTLSSEICIYWNLSKYSIEVHYASFHNVCKKANSSNISMRTKKTISTTYFACIYSHFSAGSPEAFHSLTQNLFIFMDNWDTQHGNYTRSAETLRYGIGSHTQCEHTAWAWVRVRCKREEKHSQHKQARFKLQPTEGRLADCWLLTVKDGCSWGTSSHEPNSKPSEP